MSHGNSSLDFFVVPENVIICLITPLNRLAYINNPTNYHKIINIITEANFKKELLENMSCFGKNIEQHLLQYATFFYPGQTCNNILLYLEPNDNCYKYGYSGLLNNEHLVNYPYKSYADFYFPEISSRSPNAITSDLILSNTDANNSNLKDFISYKNINGILFFTGCRSCDNIGNTNLQLTKNIYINENFYSILNKTIDNFNDINYNKCNVITDKIVEPYKFFGKARNIKLIKEYNTNSLRKARTNGIFIKQQLNKPGSIANKSLSPVNKLNNSNKIVNYYDTLLNDPHKLTKHIEEVGIKEKLETNYFSYLNYTEFYDELNKILLIDIINLQDKLDDYNTLSRINNIIQIIKNDDYFDDNILLSFLIYNCIKYIKYFLINVINNNTLIFHNIQTKSLILSGNLIKEDNYNVVEKIFLDLTPTFNAITITMLDISGNVNLDSIAFGLFIKTFINLEHIDAEKCNLSFIPKIILKLPLKSINLDRNPNLHFGDVKLRKKIQDNLNKATITDEQSEILTYDDPIFKESPLYNLFLSYIIAYIPNTTPEPALAPNSIPAPNTTPAPNTAPEPTPTPNTAPEPAPAPNTTPAPNSTIHIGGNIKNKCKIRVKTKVKCNTKSNKKYKTKNNKNIN